MTNGHDIDIILLWSWHWHNIIMHRTWWWLASTHTHTQTHPGPHWVTLSIRTHHAYIMYNGQSKAVIMTSRNDWKRLSKPVTRVLRSPLVSLNVASRSRFCVITLSRPFTRLIGNRWYSSAWDILTMVPETHGLDQCWKLVSELHVHDDIQIDT